MEPPFELAPTKIDLIWHEFKESDSGLDWLRKQLEEVARLISEEYPSKPLANQGRLASTC
ncbi:MAG: hypothetical protein AAGA91_17825 [Pseudomonadota bacterium]